MCCLLLHASHLEETTGGEKEVAEAEEAAAAAAGNSGQSILQICYPQIESLVYLILTTPYPLLSPPPQLIFMFCFFF